jgi:hypothetical protein
MSLLTNITIWYLSWFLCIIFWGFTMNNDHFLVIPFVQNQPQPTNSWTRTGRSAVHDGRPRKVREATRDCDRFDRDKIHGQVVTLWLCQNSYWKWPFIVDLPIENGDFLELC